MVQVDRQAQCAEAMSSNLQGPRTMVQCVDLPHRKPLGSTGFHDHGVHQQAVYRLHELQQSLVGATCDGEPASRAHPAGGREQCPGRGMVLDDVDNFLNEGSRVHVRGGAATRGCTEPKCLVGSLVDVRGRLPLVCAGERRVGQRPGLARGHEEDVCVVPVRNDGVILANRVARGFVSTPYAYILIHMAPDTHPRSQVERISTTLSCSNGAVSHLTLLCPTE
jgi:hypothetical protein